MKQQQQPWLLKWILGLCYVHPQIFQIFNIIKIITKIYTLSIIFYKANSKIEISYITFADTIYHSLEIKIFMTYYIECNRIIHQARILEKVRKNKIKLFIYIYIILIKICFSYNANSSCKQYFVKIYLKHRSSNCSYNYILINRRTQLCMRKKISFLLLIIKCF